MSQEQYYYSPDNGSNWVGPFDAQRLNELRASGVVQPSFPIRSDAGNPQIQGYVQPPVNPVYTPPYRNEPSLIKELFIVKFDGRMRRRKFWMLALPLWLMSSGIYIFLKLLLSGTEKASEIIAIIALIFGGIPLYIISLYFVLVGLGMSVRRLHDIGKSGWMVLPGIIPVIGQIYLLVVYCTDSQRGTNQWGPNPKGC